MDICMRIGSNIQCVMANFIFCMYMYMFFINMENYCTFIHVLMNSSKTNGTDYQVHVFIHMYLICWAGFPELNQDDQLILIKCGFFEVWLMRMARMFNKAEGCLTFEDGSIIQKEELGVVFSVSLRPQENRWCLIFLENLPSICCLFVLLW